MKWWDKCLNVAGDYVVFTSVILFISFLSPVVTYCFLCHFLHELQRCAILINQSNACNTFCSYVNLVFCFQILPSLQSFCLYAAAGLFMTYIFQITFFVACFVFDERRIEKNHNCLVVCYKHNNYKPDTFCDVEFARRACHFVYSKIIFTKPGKVIIKISIKLVIGWQIESFSGVC